MPTKAVIVEDDPVIQALARQVAHDVGVDLRVYGTLADFEPSGPAQLFILDLELPDGSGLAILESLRHRGIETPVVMLTASTMDPSQGYLRGATHWIRKSGDLDTCIRRAFSFLPDVTSLRRMEEDYPGGPTRFRRLKEVVHAMLGQAIRDVGLGRETQQRVGHQMAVHAAMFRHPVAGDLRLLESAAKDDQVTEELVQQVTAGLRDLRSRLAIDT